MASESQVGHLQLNQKRGTAISLTRSVLFILKNLLNNTTSIISFATKYLNHANPYLNYANKAVFPFYILHQTITVILGFFVMNAGIGFALKFTILSVSTFGICFLLYEFVIRRISILWPVFGLKRSHLKLNQNVIKDTPLIT